MRGSRSLAFVLLLASAGRGVSVAPRDSGAAEALDRYARAVALLTRGPDPAGAAPPPRPAAPEAASFLQAEAFFLYRPALRSPGPLSLAAEALAASTDFAPLVVWSASTDANGMRMQAYDGSAQLFEDFLARYPGSPLVPFALYRLAWAYRNVSLDVFPRGADSCARELKARFPATAYGDWADELLRLPYKRRTAADAWSLLPGAGQIYVGRPASGAVRLAIAAACAALALVPPAFMIRDRKVEWEGVALSAAGFIGIQLSYTLAFQDAERGVIAFNEAQERRFRSRHPDAP